MPELAGLKHFGKSLVTEMAPRMFGGVVNELCHRWNMDVATLTEYVQDGVSVWNKLEPEQQEQLKAVLELTSDLEFISPEPIINGIKRDFPALASLLLSWPEATDWLWKQVDEIKAQISSNESQPVVLKLEKKESSKRNRKRKK